MTDPAAKPGHPRTHLFAIRIWQEGASQAEREVRMQVHHVMSAETLFFCDWNGLAAYLRDKVASLDKETLDDTPSVT